MTCDEECVRNIVKEELSKFQPQKSSNKGNKKKSNWNIFLADCTKRQPNGTPLGDRAKACSIEYKELKNKGSLDDFITKLSTTDIKKDNVGEMSESSDHDKKASNAQQSP